MAEDLSVVIVNYNVRHFLRQTLQSVQRAGKHLDMETWVVDNNSIDNSVEMVQREFPAVKLIANKDNPGFSKANNQAIQKSDATYILILNPDTVLQEDTLDKCFQFMEKHPEAGAVGAKMLDGSGQFLPESKRGFPSPWVSFCKASGLSVLFPQSRLFNQYHLGYLDKDETHEIDVLCGAFMFIRSSVLDEVGLLDEAFFMYGEDIDLSYRIRQAGHKIFYYPDTQLIHFKGESTKKTSLNYVRVFYQAMIIFAKKHFAGRGAGFLVMLLNLAIVGRASLSLVKRVSKRVLPQLIDFLLILVGLVMIKEIWEKYYFDDPSYFQDKIIYNLALYAGIYVVSLLIHGVYRPSYRVGQIFRAIFTAGLLLLAGYALVNAEFRFSRALLLMSAAWALLSTLLLRLTIQYAKNGNFYIGKDPVKRIFVVGGRAEAQNVENLLAKTLSEHEVVGLIAPEELYEADYHNNKLSKIDQLVKLEKVNEIIFCIRDLEWRQVMNYMNVMGPHIEYKMVGDDKVSILGSKSKNTSGELYTVDFRFALGNWQERARKRLVDIFVSLSLLGLFFVFIWAQAQKGKYFTLLWSVLIGKRTMVSYHQKDTQLEELPSLKKGILSAIPKGIEDIELIHRANMLYAKDYNPWKDIDIIFKNLDKIA